MSKLANAKHNPMTRDTNKGRIVCWGTPLHRLQFVHEGEGQPLVLVGDLMDVCGDLDQKDKTVTRLVQSCTGKMKGENIAIAPEDVNYLTDAHLGLPISA